MQIYDTNPNGIPSQATTGAGETQAASSLKGKARAAAAGADGPSDAVSLSNFAQQINDLQSESPSREARVAELRAQIQGGTYQIDPAMVASRMVDDSLIG